MFLFIEIPIQKNPAYGRHQLSWSMRIVGPIQIWRSCVIFLFCFFKIGFGKKKYGGGGLTNERPGSDHVIWGPMRGLEKNCTWWRKQTQRHTDMETTRPTRPRGPSWWKCCIIALIMTLLCYYAPRPAKWTICSSARSLQSTGKRGFCNGTRHMTHNSQTLRLRDWIGPVGRLSENAQNKESWAKCVYKSEPISFHSPVKHWVKGAILKPAAAIVQGVAGLAATFGYLAYLKDCLDRDKGRDSGHEGLSYWHSMIQDR